MVLDLSYLLFLGEGVMLIIGDVFLESKEIMFETLNLMLLWLSVCLESHGVCLEVTWLVEHIVH